MNRFIIVFSVLFLFSASCKDKQTNQEEVVDNEMNITNNSTEIEVTDKKTILCFGNSLTAGYGLDEVNLAWPGLLQARLDSLEFDYKVINAGLSGETSSGGLNRIEWVLNQPIDIFILELGANDMLRGIEAKSTLTNLEGIIDIAKSKNPSLKIVIAGMMAPPNMGAQYEKHFNKIYPYLSTKHNAELIPFLLKNVAGIAELNLADAKHPNEEGQKIVLENVWGAIEGLL